MVMWNIICIIAALIFCALVFLFCGAFWVSRFGYVTCDNSVCLVGKTALVTGASTGLGHEIVLSLASRGCRVIIAGKSVTDDLKEKIIDTTDNDNIVLYQVDFTSFKSVRELAKRLNNTENKLDILVNNAGIGKSPNDDITEDGLNATMQVNHYSPFLLTHLLVDLLKRSENGRIIFTSSFLSFIHILTRRSITPTNIGNSPLIKSYFDYPNTKFLNVVTSDGFAERTKKWNVTCNVYNPLVAKTAIFQKYSKSLQCNNAKEILAYIFTQLLVRIFGISPKLTTQAAVELATSKEYRNVTGIFLGKIFPNWKPKGCDDKHFCERIWTASENVVQLSQEEKLKF